MDDPDYFLPAAAALRAGIPELEIHAAIDRGHLRAVVYRGEIRIPAESLRELTRRMRAADTETGDSASPLGQ
ncbi:hypothetical protein [Leifsonia sp. fls2-241-R2A-40a]|uniref:hypothetical protein n=1 Tax=Leifsonia sp. fls2-241-R2A-40a TaxID=3040290 RepID=UPI00254BBE55|nr:hypothetical protein [Leifsonia sp. fls2-241-R2A-40a]